MDELQKISAAAFGLNKWALATVNLYDVNKRVEPLRQKVKQLNALLSQLQSELESTLAQKNQLEKELAELEENRRIKQGRLDELTADAALMKKKLSAATKLIQGLSREKIRWTDDSKILEEKKIKLLGDCLLTSSFLSYSGPFDFEFRKKMIYENWFDDVKKRAIPQSDVFKLEELLTSDVEISQWASETLPTDELSV